MSLVFEPDVRVADWFATSHDSWTQLVSIGPSGFEAYGRIFHPLDPEGDEANLDDLASVEGHLEAGSLNRLLAICAQHTGTADDCFFGLWEGFGEIHGSPSVSFMTSMSESSSETPRAAAVIPPAFSQDVMSGPRVRVPYRDYLLFRGPLGEAGNWGAVDLVPGHARQMNSPNLMWPADHAWFVATEIDQPWTGICGTPAFLDAVLSDRELDAERLDSPAEVPYWRE